MPSDTLNAPEGYKWADGRQPRLPKAGEYYILNDGGVYRCPVDFSSHLHFILVKTR